MTETTPTESLSPLDKARAVRAANKAAGIVVPRRSPREKSDDKPQSLRLAITAKCHYCVGHETGGTKEIKECLDEACPLHKVRPYQPK